MQQDTIVKKSGPSHPRAQRTRLQVADEIAEDPISLYVSDDDDVEHRTVDKQREAFDDTAIMRDCQHALTQKVAEVCVPIAWPPAILTRNNSSAAAQEMTWALCLMKIYWRC